MPDPSGNLPRIITLTSDFGPADGYVASMKGAILSINPQATIVDITHQVPPQDILHGAYVLSATYSFFPEGSIHLAVVDPGVGSRRKAVAVAAQGHYFVGPDNGVLSLALPDECPAVELTESRYHLPEVSATFHGRDIFAPVAAHLSIGVSLDALGPPVATLQRLPGASPSIRDDGSVEGAVIHIDGFGNAITNIRRQHLVTDRVEVQVGPVTLPGLSPSYDAGEETMALWGGNGLLEIAVKNGSAAATRGLRRGDPVRVRPLR